MTTIPHSHDIDGKLHANCDQCAAIIKLRGGAVAEREIDLMSTHRIEHAEINKAGREQLAKEGTTLADMEKKR